MKKIALDFLCREEVPNIRLPLGGGTTTLHAELTINAADDPPGGIVQIFSIRGNNTSGKPNRPNRLNLCSITQGEQEQIKIESSVREGGRDGMTGGFPLQSPGLHHLVIDWAAATGITTIRSGETGATVSNAEDPAPAVGPITDGMLILGGDMPRPGKDPDYIPALGWRIQGVVIVDGTVVDPPAHAAPAAPTPTTPDPPPLPWPPPAPQPPPAQPVPPPAPWPYPWPPQAPPVAPAPQQPELLSLLLPILLLVLLGGRGGGGGNLLSLLGPLLSGAGQGGAGLGGLLGPLLGGLLGGGGQAPAPVQAAPAAPAPAADPQQALIGQLLGALLNPRR